MWGAIGTGDGAMLEQAMLSGEPVFVACKGMRIGDYGGRSLGTISASSFTINADVPEMAALRAWHEQGGYNSLSALTSAGGGGGGRSDQRCTFGMLKDMEVGACCPPLRPSAERCSRCKRARSSRSRFCRSLVCSAASVTPRCHPISHADPPRESPARAQRLVPCLRERVDLRGRCRRRRCM